MLPQLPLELIAIIYGYADIDARLRLGKIFHFHLSYRVQSSFRLPRRMIMVARAGNLLHKGFYGIPAT